MRRLRRRESSSSCSLIDQMSSCLRTWPEVRGERSEVMVAKKSKASHLSSSSVRAHLHRLEPLPRRRLLALGLVTVRGRVRVRVRARVSRPAQPRFRVTTTGLRRRLCDLACAPLLQPGSLRAQVGELGAPVLDLPPHRFLLLLRLSKGRGLAAGRAGRGHGGSHAGTPRFVRRRQARRCARHRTPTRRGGGGGRRRRRQHANVACKRCAGKPSQPNMVTTLQKLCA